MLMDKLVSCDKCFSVMEADSNRENYVKSMQKCSVNLSVNVQLF